MPDGLSLLAPSYWNTSNGAQALSSCPFGGSVHPAAPSYPGALAGGEPGDRRAVFS